MPEKISTRVAWRLLEAEKEYAPPAARARAATARLLAVPAMIEDGKRALMIDFLKARRLITIPSSIGPFLIRQLPEAFKPSGVPRHPLPLARERDADGLLPTAGEGEGRMRVLITGADGLVARDIDVAAREP